jgi:site-specific recombinase
LSNVQKEFHKKIEAAGGHVEVVYSLEDVIAVIDRLMISVDKEYKFIEDQWWAKV